MLKHFEIKNYRFRLIAYVVILAIIGVFMVGSAKPSLQDKQLLGFVGGLVVMVVVSLIDFNYLLRFYRIWYILTLLMLAAVLIIGKDVNGAKRWIPIAGFQFQPSEISKILIILFFAMFFVRHRDTLNTWKTILFTIILAAFPLLLIIKEPNLSTTIIVTLIVITLLFIAGLSYKIIARVLAVGVPLGIVTLVLLVKQLLPLKEYQYSRILAWVDPAKYADQATQQQYSIKAIGSGQLWGIGFNSDSVYSIKTGNFLPEPQTDFIFAVVGEEIGFIGCMVIIILMLLIVFECIMVAKNAVNLSGRLICCGVAAILGFQSFVNIGVASGLLPNTGVPLPFVSYGLTSLISSFIGIGLVLNVGLQARKYGTGDME